MKRVVLMGAGHAHALVLQELKKASVADTEILMISPEPLAPYSGMIPGWLAGRYTLNDISIDFQQLSKAAGVRWLQGEMYSLDPDNNRLLLTDGSRIEYDVLSLNVGSTLYPPRSAMLAMRPLGELISKYQNLLRVWQSSTNLIPSRLTVVGGGPAGFETLLAVRTRLLSLSPRKSLETTLITRSHQILPEQAWLARQLALRAFKKANVQVNCNSAWTDSSSANNKELVIWAAGAQAHAWQRDEARRGSLAVNEHGFIRVDAQLRSVSHPTIFAAGDCAQLSQAVPKAGVYAVRMGPLLAHNLRALCCNKQLADYVPQTHHLALLNTSDGSAIATRGLLAASGQWAMHLKNRIDHSFIAQFRSEHYPINASLAD